MVQLNTYRKKNMALLVGTILLGIFAYLLSFSKTVHELSEAKKIKTELTQLELGMEHFPKQQKQLALLNQQLGGLISSEVLAQDTILDVLSAYCDTSNVRIRSFPETIHQDKDGFQIETNIIEVSGPFHSLVKLCYLVEYENKISRVSSVKFVNTKDYATKKTYLLAVLYFQNLKIKA